MTDLMASIKQRITKLSQLVISPEEAAERDQLDRQMDNEAKTMFKSGENHLQAMFRINRERIKTLASG